MFKIDNNNNILKGYKFIDLFCGIGGFHLALSSFGCECVFASEINQKNCAIYNRNFHIFPEGDIRKIKCKDIPKHDILCAGFPCQPFSISGSKKGFDDPNGKLFYQIIRIARYHKPKILILENVKNLVAHNNGNSLKEIKEKLNSIGYYTFSEVLCATDFGVPQARKRLYIVAFRKSLKINTFEFPIRRGELRVLDDILEQEVDDHYIITRDYTVNLNNENENNRNDSLVRIGSINQGRQGERIYSKYGQAITLSSQGGGIGGKTGMYYIDNSVRKLTPRECARLMGFPDDYIISASDNECYFQFGNSVVVDVLQSILIKINEVMGGLNNG